MSLQDHLASADIEFFSARELTLQRRWRRTETPPKHLWQNIIPTARVADTIRRAWGGPVIVGSGYRSPDYNTVVGGAPGSEHTVFRAMDIYPSNGHIEEFQWVVKGVVAAYRDQGWNVGLGLYNRFVHIDVNAEGKRRNRTWDMR